MNTDQERIAALEARCDALEKETRKAIEYMGFIDRRAADRDRMRMDIEIAKSDERYRQAFNKCRIPFSLRDK